MAQLVVAAVGAGVGVLVGGPAGAQIGWALGSVLGSQFGPTQKSQGPRLDDLKVTGTEYGQPIDWVQGHPRKPGQVWWASERRELATTTEQGKGTGGAEYTSYTYEVDILYGLSDNELAGLRRVWLNGKLVWSLAEDASDETVSASGNSEKWADIRFYSGAEDQLPDPTYEAAVGVGNAPAYRGRCTIFIEGLQLGSSGTIPNLTFEVFSKGESGDTVGGFEEDFVSSVGDIGAVYTATSGDFGDFTVAPVSIGGYGLSGLSRTSVGIADTIQRPAVATAVSLVEFNFHIGSEDGDDALEIIILDGIAVKVNLNPRREAAFDALQRPYLNIMNEGAEPIYSTALPTGVWYKMSIVVAEGAGMTHATMTRVSDGAVLGTRTLVGNYMPFNMTTLVFNIDATNGISASSTATYAHIECTGIGERVAVEEETLEDVVSRLCLRAGLSEVQFDVSPLAAITKPVHSLVVSQIGGTRATLDLLMSCYFFEMVLSDKLYFRPRGGSSVVTIPYEDIGCGEEPSGAEEPLALRMNNELEIPAEISLTYANLDSDYNSDTQSSDRLLTAQGSTAQVQVPMSFTASEAKGIVDAMLGDQASSVISTQLALPISYARLEPTDVVTVTGQDGSLYRMRLVKKTDAAGVLTFDAVLDDASVLISAGITSDDYTGSSVVTLPAETILELMDIPILRDVDDTPGYYVAAKGTTTAWPGAGVYSSVNDVDFAQEIVMTSAAVTGYCSTTLGNWTGGAVIDELNSLTVNLGAGQMSSSTRDLMFADQTINALLVGSEIIRYINATMDSPGVYTLTGLFRGQRGTDWAISGHVATERCVLLSTSSIRRVTSQLSEIGTLGYYKGVTLGKSLANVASEEFTDTGIALKPFSVADIRIASNNAQDILLTWKRRTRLSTRFAGPLGMVVPLGEATEAYLIDVYTGSTLLSTLSSTSQSVTYSAEQQITDGVSGATSLRFDVYQVSADVGRGTVASITGVGQRTPLAQISTVTLSGTYASGAALFVLIGSSRFDYTSTVGDATLGGIATSLAALIDASTRYVASAVGSVITITGPMSEAEPLTAGHAAGDNTITFTTTQTASDVVEGIRSEISFVWRFPSADYLSFFGAFYFINVRRFSDGFTRNYTTSADQDGYDVLPSIRNGIYEDFLASGDREAFDFDMVPNNSVGSSSFFYPVTGMGGWDLSVGCSDPNIITGAASRGVGVEAVPVARPQIATATLAGTPVAGRIYRITLDGVAYSYTATGGDTTMALVAAGLAPVIDAASAYLASAAGAVITITGAVANVPFVYSGQVITSTVAVSAAITQTAV